MKIAYRHAALALAVLGVGASAWLALREEPVPVDVAVVERGAMTVTVDEEGIARVRELYVLSTPIAGHLARPSLEVGDRVAAHETVAAIHPLDPPFLDRRTEAELAAALEATRSAVARAELERERAAAGRDLARTEHARARRLAASEAISESALERSAAELRVAEATLRSAEASIRLHRAELASAEARRAQPNLDATDLARECCVAIRAPIDGVVLALAEESERPVAVGAPIAEIGDPDALEVRVEVLSQDAARLEIGAPVRIDDWGGEEALAGRIERIEPTAVEHVSALGIVERRVEVIVALERVPPRLGHGFHVRAELAVWRSPEALKVPIGALFREGGKWAVFVHRAGVARLAPLRIGRMSDTHAEVLEGLAAGEEVVLYPSDRVVDGAPLVFRDGARRADGSDDAPDGDTGDARA